MKVQRKSIGSSFKPSEKVLDNSASFLVVYSAAVLKRCFEMREIMTNSKDDIYKLGSCGSGCHNQEEEGDNSGKVERRSGHTSQRGGGDHGEEAADTGHQLLKLGQKLPFRIFFKQKRDEKTKLCTRLSVSLFDTGDNFLCVRDIKTNYPPFFFDWWVLAAIRARGLHATVVLRPFAHKIVRCAPPPTHRHEKI